MTIYSELYTNGLGLDEEEDPFPQLVAASAAVVVCFVRRIWAQRANRARQASAKPLGAFLTTNESNAAGQKCLLVSYMPLAGQNAS